MANLSFKIGKKVSDEEINFFIQHFALLLRAGIAIPRALMVLASQAQNEYWKSVLLDVRANVMKGNTMEKALQQNKKIFSPSFISMVKVGELKGDLGSVLETYSKLVQRESFIKEKVRSALIYPVFVVVAMVVLGAFSMTYIFPKIVSMFEELQGELPLVTKLMIKVSHFFSSYTVFIFAAFFILVVGLGLALRTKRGKYFFHLFMLKMPIVAPIVKTYNLARISQNLGVLLKSGIPISEALLSTSEILTNVFYKQSLVVANDEIHKGNFINTAFRMFPELYSDVIVQIIDVGEESGILDEMLEEISDFYEKRLSLTLDTLASLLEPILILILGAGVAFMAMSIIMPIYNLSSLV